VIALNKKIIFILMSLVMLSGCREEDDSKISAYRELRALPHAEIERKVMALPPKEQVDLYVLAISYFRPSDTQLASMLAKQGPKILPPLIEQLEKAEPGVSPQELVLVLYMMVTAYNVEEARLFAPRVDAWCNRYYKTDTYCHKMGREMLALSGTR
jgi:hypothetical protein